MAGEPGGAELEVATENFARRSEIVEKAFEPKTETDQAGFKRSVYKYGDTTFSFRGREELPTTPAFSSSRTELLGSEPVHTDKNSFEKYRGEVESRADDGKERLLVTKDVQGVIGLALELGAKDENLTTMRDEVRKGIYSGRTLDLIDKLVAANCITDGKNEWTEKLTGGDAEALVLLALLGNTYAEEYLDSKLEQMRELDSTIEEREHDNGNGKLMRASLENSAKRVGELVAVHATRFSPVGKDDGSYEVGTTGEATNWEFLRNTVHVTCNHKVLSHGMGSWDDTRFVLLSPMEDMFRVNGMPRCLQQQDTWWVRNPGETLKFPKARLVEPGDTPVNSLYVIDGKHTVFKSKDFTVGELVEIKDLRGAELDIAESFKSVLFDREDLRQTISTNWDIERMSQLFDTDQFGKIEQLLADTKNNMVIDGVKNVLGSVDLRSAFRGEEAAYQMAFEQLSQYLNEEIQKSLYSQLSIIAVRKTIEEMGYRPIEGDSSFSSRHNYSPEYWLNKGLIARVEDAQEPVKLEEDGTEVLGNFDWVKFNPEWGQIISLLDAKTRRVLYASGAFNSREE